MNQFFKTLVLLFALSISFELSAQSRGVASVNSDGLIQISGNSLSDEYSMNISHLGITNTASGQAFFNQYVNSDFIKLNFDFRTGIALMEIEHNKVMDSKLTEVSLNKLLASVKTYGK